MHRISTRRPGSWKPVHAVLRDRLDVRGFYLVALKDDVDAVHFKLRWADHLVT